MSTRDDRVETVMEVLAQGYGQRWALDVIAERIVEALPDIAREESIFTHVCADIDQIITEARIDAGSYPVNWKEVVDRIASIVNGEDYR